MPIVKNMQAPSIITCVADAHAWASMSMENAGSSHSETLISPKCAEMRYTVPSSPCGIAMSVHDNESSNTCQEAPQAETLGICSAQRQAPDKSRDE